MSIFIFLIALVLFSIEGYVPFAPYIDTVFTKDFTWEKWEQVEAGMKTSDVYALIGTPVEVFESNGNYGTIKAGEAYNNHRCETYSADGAAKFWDFAWISMNVCYDEEGNVLGKNELIMNN